MRILLIEDDRQIASGVEAGLSRAGHQVRVVHDGVYATEHLLREQHDLVILDLVMPDVDGYAVARALRNLHVSARIVALTAFTQPAFLEAANDVGFDSVMATPATADQLADLLVSE